MGDNHTFKVEIVLGNLLPKQLDEIDELITTLESEGIVVISYTVEND